MKLSGKVVLVTGGGTGIGRATSLLFAREGASVVINYSRSEKEARETASLVEKEGQKTLVIKADVRDDGAVRTMVDRTVKELGGLDILVNNAGVTTFIDFKDLEGLTDELWDQVLDVNLKGAFHCARAAIPAMLARGGGSIVNVSSVSGIWGRGSSIAYCASKAGLICMTKSLARTFGPEIRVNAIAPGVVMTRWQDGSDLWKQFLPQMVMKRPAQPEDIAEAILFLATNTEFVTGQILVVDGGVLI